MFKNFLMTTTLALHLPLAFCGAASAQTVAKPPNIVVVMGDDIGWFKSGPITVVSWPAARQPRQTGPRGCCSPITTPRRLHRRSRQFITGELPIRTGLTTVGQAGSTLGMPAQRDDCRSAN